MKYNTILNWDSKFSIGRAKVWHNVLCLPLFLTLSRDWIFKRNIRARQSLSLPRISNHAWPPVMRICLFFRRKTLDFFQFHFR